KAGLEGTRWARLQVLWRQPPDFPRSAWGDYLPHRDHVTRRRHRQGSRSFRCYKTGPEIGKRDVLLLPTILEKIKLGTSRDTKGNVGNVTFSRFHKLRSFNPLERDADAKLTWPTVPAWNCYSSSAGCRSRSQFRVCRTRTQADREEQFGAGRTSDIM